MVLLILPTLDCWYYGSINGHYNPSWLRGAVTALASEWKERPKLSVEQWITVQDTIELLSRQPAKRILCAQVSIKI